MSRFRCVWLCAIVALAGVVLLRPASVHAGSGSLTRETSPLPSLDPAAAVIALLPAGTSVAVDGPPVDGFYLVTASDLSGWMPGETLAFEKYTPEPAALEESEANPLVDDTDEMASVEDPAAQDPATDTSAALTESPPGAEPAAADEAIPGGEPVSAEAASGVNDPAPVDAPAADSVVAPTEPELDSTGAAVPVAPGDESPPLESASTAPAADATVAPIPIVEVAPVGPASVAVDAPILAGPGSEHGFIATAPAGSTVVQTGHVINGYVTVQHGEVTGWVALEHLGAPSTGIEESPSVEPAPGEAPRADAPPVDASPAETSPTKTVRVEVAPGDAAPAEVVPVAAP